MARERLDLVEVADSGTEFGAEILAEAVRGAGIRAAVLAPDVLSMAGFGTWRVVVARADAAAARGAIIAARDGSGAVLLENCPACGYALAGLDAQAKCPECGLVLAAARTEALVRGVRVRGVMSPALRPTMLAWLGFGALACCAAGFVQLRLYPWSHLTFGGWAPAVSVVPLFAVAAVAWTVVKVRRRHVGRG